MNVGALDLWDLLAQVNLQPEVDDSTFGILHLLRNIQRSRLMIVSSKDQYILALGNTFGRVGFRVNFASSCGWLSYWMVDRLAHRGLQHPPRWLAAHCLIKKVKQLITFW